MIRLAALLGARARGWLACRFDSRPAAREVAWPAVQVRRPPVSLIVAVGLGTACSTIDTAEPGPQCEIDTDCEQGEVCATDQGNRCVDGRPAPRATLAFALNEKSSTFGVELRGCDEEISREGTQLSVRPRDEVASQVLVTATETLEAQLCVCPEGWSCELESQLCIAPLTSTLTLRQGSRLGRDPAAVVQRAYPVLDDEGVPIPDQAALVEWPRYEDAAVTPPLLIDIEPAETVPPRARVRRAVIELDAVTQADLRSRVECQRRVVGLLRRENGAGIDGATVTVRYAEETADASVVTPVGSGPQCVEDSECPVTMRCDPLADRCTLDLRGVQASAVTTGGDGSFLAPLYSYCDAQPVTQLDLRYVVSFPGDGSSNSALPSMNFVLTQDFADPGVGGNVPNDPLSGGDLCVPDWDAPVSGTLVVGAAPRTVLTDDLGRDWVCCDLSCLPLDVAPETVDPQAPPAVCASAQSLRFTAFVDQVDEAAWTADGCLIPTADAEGHLGRFDRFLDLETCTDGSCPLTLPVPDSGVPYFVAVQQGTSSVFASSAGPLEWPIESGRANWAWTPRVLVHGKVVCNAETSCNAANASVRAERLRVEGESSATALPPYYFEQSALVDGRFTLALDPGLYVVTAVPAPGALGGPSPFQILDLREGSAEVNNGSNGPELQLGDELQLGEGRPVRLALPLFSSSTAVSPMDFGSWKLQSDFGPDLNDPATCWAESGLTACRIRALRPGSLLASGLTQFTARDLGETMCQSGG